MPGKTLYDKLWDQHVVHEFDDGTTLIYIDRHIIHEVTSPQAFEGLKLANRPLWSDTATKATSDHNVPTRDIFNVTDAVAKKQLETLTVNCQEFGVLHHDVGALQQGIVHVTGPEQGWSLPGMTIVCGDSHTATNGALAAMAFGIGTSEIEHVFATQCLPLRKMKNLRVNFRGSPGLGVTPKDMILAVIGKIGTAGGTSHAIEYAGEAIEKMSMEGRMTVCNMSIEAGARIGMVAFDEKTEAYITGRPFAPAGETLQAALREWRDLKSDDDAQFDTEIEMNTADIPPQVTWGTSPEMVIEVTGEIPDPEAEDDEVKRIGMRNALAYMDLKPGTPIADIPVDRVFIGSCTNSRIEDLRAAAEVVEGKHVAGGVTEALIVPGSGLVKKQAEDEGLHEVFEAAGFEWREPGCSMCLGMNPDQLEEGERCASTSNRNFEGRQGRGGRTHLVSPAMAAAAAIAGHFVDVREFG